MHNPTPRNLFDDFTLLGEDAEGSDVEYAFAAQREVITDDEAKNVGAWHAKPVQDAKPIQDHS